VIIIVYSVAIQSHAIQIRSYPYVAACFQQRHHKKWVSLKKLPYLCLVVSEQKLFLNGLQRVNMLCIGGQGHNLPASFWLKDSSSVKISRIYSGYV
jgi:expansin (peptidoglycan-binding protein)